MTKVHPPPPHPEISSMWQYVNVVSSSLVLRWYAPLLDPLKRKKCTICLRFQRKKKQGVPSSERS